MTPFSRRDTLRIGGSALASLALPGCAGKATPYPVVPITGQLIDAHAHFFNGTDLPITTFLTRLFLPAYDPKTCTYFPQPPIGIRGEIDNPGALELAVQLVVEWLLSATPTAREELARLKADQNGSLEGESARVATRTRNKLADFLDGSTAAVRTLRAQREDQLREALWQEAAAASGEKTLLRSEPHEGADRILRAGGTFGRIFTWAQLFFRSRESLAQELVHASGSWGRKPLMLVPLMVDYAHWLGETTSCNSSFDDQVAVYAEISRRSSVPIHGMVAYDPLRAVFWKLGKHDRFKTTPEFDPLDLARRAVTDHGFVGLKLYPPMGFRATGNSNDDADYPEDAIKALQPNGTLGAELDAAMERAIDLCIELDVPLIAHATNSLAAGPGYGARAEPRYWIEALKAKPRLRLCLAHAGRFCWLETAPPEGTPALKSSWEWTIGRYVKANPSSHLYMDLSYLSEVVTENDRPGFVADQLRDWIKDCDPEARHILFGTDWTMLGKEQDFPKYGTTVIRFLKDRCHLTDDQLERVMWQNAMRFLGLDSGQTRDRLLKFYNGRRPAWTEITLPPDPLRNP